MAIASHARSGVSGTSAVPNARMATSRPISRLKPSTCAMSRVASVGVLARLPPCASRRGGGLRLSPAHSKHLQRGGLELRGCRALRRPGVELLRRGVCACAAADSDRLRAAGVRDSDYRPTDLMQRAKDLASLIAQDEIALPSHDFPVTRPGDLAPPATRKADFEDALPTRLAHLGHARAFQIFAQEHDEGGRLDDELARLFVDEMNAASCGWAETKSQRFCPPPQHCNASDSGVGWMTSSMRAPRNSLRNSSASAASVSASTVAWYNSPQGTHTSRTIPSLARMRRHSIARAGAAARSSVRAEQEVEMKSSMASGS